MSEQTCIFCKIAAGEIPAVTVYEDADFRVFMDLGPATKGHVLIVPKAHAADLTELPEALAAKALPLAASVGRALMKGLGCCGFNLVQNNGEAAGQTVHHFHIHLIPRYGDEGEMVLWQPGNAAPEELRALASKISAALGA